MNPPLPKGYSTSTILTYRKCGHKFLVIHVFHAKIEKTASQSMGSDIHSDISECRFISEDPEKQRMLNVGLTNI